MDTLLHLAAYTGCSELIEYLLANYPEQVNAFNQEDVCPLAILVRRQHWALLPLFQKVEIVDDPWIFIPGRRYEQDFRDFKDYFFPKPLGSVSLLHAAVEEQDISALNKIEELDNYLLKYLNVSVFQAKYKAHLTPLFLAILKGDIGIILWLLEQARKLGSDISNTLCHFKRDSCLFEQLKLLEGDLTPLHMATLLNRPDIVLLLLEYGARAGECPQHSPVVRTPLQTAMLKGYTEIVHVLIQHDPDIDHNINRTIVRGGETPLGTAIRRGNKDLVEKLYQAGADVIHIDNDYVYDISPDIAKLIYMQRIRNWLQKSDIVNEREKIIALLEEYAPSNSSVGRNLQGFFEGLRSEEKAKDKVCKHIAQYLVLDLRQMKDEIFNQQTFTELCNYHLRNINTSLEFDCMAECIKERLEQQNNTNASTLKNNPK